MKCKIDRRSRTPFSANRGRWAGVRLELRRVTQYYALSVITCKSRESEQDFFETLSKDETNTLPISSYVFPNETAIVKRLTRLKFLPLTALHLAWCAPRRMKPYALLSNPAWFTAGHLNGHQLGLDVLGLPRMIEKYQGVIRWRDLEIHVYNTPTIQ